MRPSLILGHVDAVHRQVELLDLGDVLSHELVQALHFGQPLILSLTPPRLESKKSPTGMTERTPKPEYLISLAPYLGVRW